MKQNASILNNSYNGVDRGDERTSQNSTITISPLIDTYEESTTEDIENLYSTAKLYDILYEEFLTSPFYEKYGKPVLKKKYKQETDEKITNDFVIGDDDDTSEEQVPSYEDENESDSYDEENGSMYGIDDYTRDSSAMEKYVFKNVEKNDIPDIYCYFKDILSNKNGYNELDAFCAIAEFFKLNYSNLYHDVISIESKAKILEILKENHRLGSEFKQVGRLY